MMNTSKLNTTAYHPQTDGLVERFNGTLAQTLSMFVSSNQKDWDQHLPQVLFAYRVSPNATTGESPFYLFMVGNHGFQWTLVYFPQLI